MFRIARHYIWDVLLKESLIQMHLVESRDSYENCNSRCMESEIGSMGKKPERPEWNQRSYIFKRK